MGFRQRRSKPCGTAVEALCPSRAHQGSQKSPSDPRFRRSEGLFFCGAKGSRTPDICHAKTALYQLSYGPFAHQGTGSRRLIPTGYRPAPVTLRRMHGKFARAK